MSRCPWSTISFGEIARRRMAGERPDHTLQATELVHEAYLQLRGNQ
ncbi:MAG: ECF-type sigma factor [Candidatus Eisenbacteria bacterium]